MDAYNYKDSIEDPESLYNTSKNNDQIKASKAKNNIRSASFNARNENDRLSCFTKIFSCGRNNAVIQGSRQKIKKIESNKLIL